MSNKIVPAKYDFLCLILKSMKIPQKEVFNE